MGLTVFYLLIITTWCANARTTLTHEPEDARQKYEEFKLRYQKSYGSFDDEYRFGIFKDNLVRAKQLQDVEQGTAEYGVTQFSDLTSEEFANKYLGVQLDEPATEEEVDSEDVTVADDSFDWRQHGAVGPVRNQGRCGSCWAFSTVGNIEGQWFLKSGELLQLSVQQVLDCDHVDHGCNGGYPPQVYDQVNKMGGLELDADYSYKAFAGGCHMDRSKFRAYVNSSAILLRNEQFQAYQLKKIGPLASTLNARTLQFYQKGIMHPTRNACNPGELNHAVLTVGYGTEQGIPYWIVKNSWSKDFGEQGYFRIFRGDGTCGINRLVSTAIVK